MPRPKAGRRSAMPRVVLCVRGGVAEVLFKPLGLEVDIFDYDVDGEDADRLDRDPDGQLCSLGCWEASEAVSGNEHWPIIRSAARKVTRKRRQRWR
jgi:hypothetical protein